MNELSEMEGNRIEYYVDADGDGHRYIVPYNKRYAFRKWAELDSGIEESWTPPAYAKHIDGSMVIFKEYRLE